MGKVREAKESMRVGVVVGVRVLGSHRGRGRVRGCRDLVSEQKRPFIPFGSANSTIASVNCNTLICSPKILLEKMFI